MKIGNISAGGTGNGFFHGAIDDIRIYDRALSSNDIQNLYQENGWIGNLVAYYPFNGDANDFSGHGHKWNCKWGLLS